MFSKIIAEAQEFTRSVITLFKLEDGKLTSLIGTYVHIDDFGHILSAHHIYTPYERVDHTSFIFDHRYTSAEVVAQDQPNDLIILKLKDYKQGSITSFPKFKNNAFPELPTLTRLVRLGYPVGPEYSQVTFDWVGANRGFKWNNEQTKTVCYANEGSVLGYVERDSGARFLETDSAALMGQSGGPLLDLSGTLVGLQSRNSVYEEPLMPSVETGLASSHIAIGRLLQQSPQVKPNWV